MLQRVDHQQGCALGVLEPHELDLAAELTLDTSRQLSDPRGRRVGQRNQKVDIRAIMATARRQRSEQHREPNAWLGSECKPQGA